MNKDTLIQKTTDYVKKELSGEGTGHDWWHIHRVLVLARRIAKEEQGVDLFIVELAALLHDIADWKFHGGDDSAGSRVARKWLEELGVEEKHIQHVCEIIEHISFKGAGVRSKIKTMEGKIVQDADRLDALGAIGIARVFTYSGYFRQEMHDPNKKPVALRNKNDYKKHVSSKQGTSINHFYEKLLLLKDRVNTKAGKRIAEERHKYMEEFLDRFHKEWEGEE